MAFALSLGAVWSGTAARGEQTVDADGLLARVTERVERYYDRAQNIMSTESVEIQPLGSDMRSDGFSRRLVYEIRIAWEAAAIPDRLPSATVVRELIKANGRNPRPNDKPQCLDPKPVSPEPLAMLLPANRKDYEFKHAGNGKTDGRTATMLDFKSVSTDPAEVTWEGDCVSVSLPGNSRGRIWIDVETGDVLRIDERLTSPYDLKIPPDKRRIGAGYAMTIERADTSIKYKAFEFTDPDETLLLPTSIESMTVFRGSGTPRVRTTRKLSNYRRFIADSHLVQ